LSLPFWDWWVCCADQRQFENGSYIYSEIMLPFQLVATKMAINWEPSEAPSVQSDVRAMVKNIDRPIAGWWQLEGNKC
jgi:hypothetical protein